MPIRTAVTIGTQDSVRRAILTIDVTGNTAGTGADWYISIDDNAPTYSGFGSSGASWSLIINGDTVETQSGKSYDFGSGNVSNPYFPRSKSGFKTLPPGTYSARGSFSAGTLVGTATIPAFNFTVVAATTTYTATYYANNATSGSTSATSYVSPTSASGTVATNGFVRTGYYFTGWNTAANGTGTAYSEGSTFTGNLNLYAQWSPNTYTISYNSSNGSVSGTGTTSASSVSYPATSITTRASGFTAPSGYAFGGWSTSQDNTVDYAVGTGPSGFDLSSSQAGYTYYAVWVQTNPVFSNSGITTTGTLARNINTNADFTVAASPVTGYSIIYSGSGLNPTSWLSINSAGQLSGIPTAIGTYTFKIRATYNSYNTDTAEISFVVSPPGFRMTGSSTKTRLASAKRFIGIGQSTTNFQGQVVTADAQGYVSLTKMAVYKAGIWTDISNVS